MTNTDGGVDPWLSFSHDVTGYLTEDNDSGGGLDAQIFATLPSDGNYVILTNCFNSSGSGNYTLSLNTGGVVSQNPPSPPTVTQMNYGDVLSGYKDACNFPDYYSFSGSTGEVIEIYMNQNSGNLDPTLALWSPSNQLVAEDDDGGGFPHAYLGNIVLPETGTYNINAGCVGGTGDYTIGLQWVVHSTGSTSTPPPANNPPPIQNGGFITGAVFGEFAPNDCPATWYYSFEGHPGEVVNLEMYQDTGDLDPYIAVFSPTNTPLGEDDDSLGFPNAGLYNISLTEDGTYTINARCLSGSGRFRLDLWWTQ